MCGNCVKMRRWECRKNWIGAMWFSYRTLVVLCLFGNKGLAARRTALSYGCVPQPCHAIYRAVSRYVPCCIITFYDITFLIWMALCLPVFIILSELFKFQDYHVIFLYSWDCKTCLVYDLDSELPFPTFFHKYVTETFRTDQVVNSDFYR